MKWYVRELRGEGKGGVLGLRSIFQGNRFKPDEAAI